MTTFELYQQAFSEGERAFYAGTKRADNPHGPATYQREYWLQGWDLGRQEAEDDAKTDCERAFQNGGPRVYVLVGGYHTRHLRPSSHSATRTLTHCEPGDIVMHRAKRGRVFVWHAMHKVSP